MTQSQKLTLTERRHEIFRRLSETIDPKSDLEYSNPFELLIAVILSAQATDKQVNKATAPLFARANTPQAILQLGLPNLEEALKTIGLFRAKAKNVLKTCEILIRDHNGLVPNNREALQALPGVGPKTAGVVLNIAFGAPTIPVDTHVFRVSKRLGLSRAKTPEKTEPSLLKSIPKTYHSTAHHLLILHGRYTCTARKPRCENCIIEDLCQSKDKTHRPPPNSPPHPQSAP